MGQTKAPKATQAHLSACDFEPSSLLFHVPPIRDRNTTRAPRTEVLRDSDEIKYLESCGALHRRAGSSHPSGGSERWLRLRVPQGHHGENRSSSRALVTEGHLLGLAAWAVHQGTVPDRPGRAGVGTCAGRGSAAVPAPDLDPEVRSNWDKTLLISPNPQSPGISFFLERRTKGRCS